MNIARIIWVVRTFCKSWCLLARRKNWVPVRKYAPIYSFVYFCILYLCIFVFASVPVITYGLNKKSNSRICFFMTFLKFAQSTLWFAKNAHTLYTTLKGIPESSDALTKLHFREGSLHRGEFKFSHVIKIVFNNA